MKSTIQEVESQLEAGLATPVNDLLHALIPEGYSIRCRLIGQKRGKKKNASADNWSPDTGDALLISFERLRQPGELQEKQAARRMTEWDFNPVTIRGESLSATVLRERR